MLCTVAAPGRLLSFTFELALRLLAVGKDIDVAAAGGHLQPVRLAEAAL